MQNISIRVKTRPEKGCTDESDMELPILPPHLLTKWLLDMGLLSFDEDEARRYWNHFRERKAPWMTMHPFQDPDASAKYQPFAMYGDEAEYTLTKEKILIIFASPLLESYIQLICISLYIYQLSICRVMQPCAQATRCKPTRPFGGAGSQSAF